MIIATLTLSAEDLNAAVEEWLNKRGVLTTSQFRVKVKTTPSIIDDTDHTEVTVTGVKIAAIVDNDY